MMEKLGKSLGVARPEYIIVFLLIAILGLVTWVGGNQRFFLNFYFLPVVIAGYTLGVRGGVLSAVASVSVVMLFFLVFRPELVPVAGNESVTVGDVRAWWADIALWAGFLVLSGGAVGKLYERSKLALDDLRQAYSGVLEILVKFIDTADRYTEAHSVRVSILSTEIARELSLPEQEIEDIRVAALLHDVGKLDVSIDVIRKAGKLDDDEWEQLKKHPEHGANIVEQMGGMLSNAVPIILFHHEQYNGNGYYGRKGDQIPLGARIIAVADAFDAMTTDRPYQKARQTWEALEIIEKGKGEHFDPGIVDAFASVMRRRPEGVQRVQQEQTRLI
jgi:putative nucleotidyltransferase with HDIG domain